MRRVRFTFSRLAATRPARVCCDRGNSIRGAGPSPHHCVLPALQEVATRATSHFADSVRENTVLDAAQLRESAGRARRVRHISETKAV